jgi:hypothetical protein
MGLLPQSLALRELRLDEDERAKLDADLQLLDAMDGNVEMLTRLALAPAGCLIEEVRLLANEELRRLEIQGENAGLFVEGSMRTGEIRIRQL